MKNECDDILSWVKLSITLPENSWKEFNSDFKLREALHESAQELADASFRGGDRKASEDAHQCLAAIYNVDFATAALDTVDCEMQPILRDVASVLEEGFLAYEQSLMQSLSLDGYPENGKGYVKWLKNSFRTIGPVCIRYITITYLSMLMLVT